MITPAVVEEIKRLLDSGHLSQRTIARQLGVSRGTVNAIALGKRLEPGPDQNPDPGFAAPEGPLTRCPGCGGLVMMPCLLCHVRAMRERERWPTDTPNRPAAPRRDRQAPCTSPIDRRRTRRPSDRS
ncbi:MAG: helix-turn-helix domain-containing protein [Thermoguttaceae bacterium]|jgi:hypothetical protein